MEKKLDQIKIDLDTDTVDIVNEEPVQANKEANKKRSKPKKEPETISIEENYYIDEEGDRLAPPKKDIFEKLSGITNLDDCIDSSNNSDSDNSENFKEAMQSDSDNEAVSRKKNKFSDNIVDQDSGEVEAQQGNIYSDSFEYTHRKQRKDVIGMYKFAKSNIRTKIIFVSILSVILFFIENISLFIKSPTGFLSNPYVLTISNTVVLLICAIISYEQLYHGVKSIASKDYIPESVAVVATICSLIHSLLMILFISFENEPRLYNFPVAIILLSSLIYSYITVSREKYGFGVVSSKDVKYYLEKATRGDDDSETETFSSSIDDFEGEIARVKKTTFISKYFANTNTPPMLRSYLSIYLTASIVIPAILAIVSLFNGYDFFKAVNVLYVGILFMLPVGILYSYSVPFLKGNRYLYNDDTAIIGENAIPEFTSTDVASVNDTTAFPPYNVKLTFFQVFNKFKTEKVLYYAASGFSVVGGPLAEVFGSATKEAFTKSADAEFTCAGKDYFCVKINGDTVVFADRNGMSSRGIDVGAMSENEGSSSVLYMACNSVLCAKIFLDYSIDEEFVEIVTNLNKNKVTVGIRTFDPNINQALISDLTKGIKVDLKVIRLVYEEAIPVMSVKSEGKIVSRGQSKHLLKAIPVCKKISNIRKATRVIKILASLAGATMVGLSIFGLFSLINSVFITCYQLAVMLVMAIITAIVMPKSK